MSPYSYLDRGIIVWCILAFYIFRMWATDRFASVSLTELKSGRTKPFMVILFGLSLLCLSISDGLSISFKYAEGWTCSEMDDGSHMAKVASKGGYSAESTAKLVPADVFWNLAMTFKTSGLFLVNTLWHFILNNEGIGESPMGALEFRASCVYSLVSTTLYFIIQAIFRFNPLYSGVFPQVWYNFETLILFALTTKSVFMFRGFAKTMVEGSIAQAKLLYFGNLNAALAATLFFDCIFGLAPNLDLFTEAKVINKSTFLLDFNTRFFNITHFLEYCLLIAIMFPIAINAAAKTAATKSRMDAKSKAGQSRGGGTTPAQVEVAPRSIDPRDSSQRISTDAANNA